MIGKLKVTFKKEHIVDKKRYYKVSSLRKKYICPSRKPKCGHVIISRDTPQGVICPKCNTNMEKFDYET